MRTTFVCLVLLASLRPAAADEPRKGPVPSPDSELAAAVLFLRSLPPDLQPHVRFFTTYNLPPTKTVRLGGEDVPFAEAAAAALSFAVNSTASITSPGIIKRPRSVPTSPTLLWIDLRDYGWDVGRWERVAALDPYFRVPLVDYGLYSAGLALAGNLILRADWFVVNALDTTQQIDKGQAEIAYYALLYGDKAPADVDEFRQFWGVDVAKIKKFRTERGAVVDTGNSGVSRNIRRFFGARTELGYYWETFDAKALDYLEDPLLEKRDATELIASHVNGLQVYLLADGAGKRVDFADNALVTDSDPHDARVRTAKSCVVCHAVGINPVDDEFAKLLSGGDVDLYAKDEFRQKIEALYLRGDTGPIIEADNKLYEAAVAKCNGLEPADNVAAFVALTGWYLHTPLDLEQAAREVGVTPETFTERVRPTISGRLAGVIRKEKPIPRLFWEELDGGAYTEAVLQVKKIDPARLLPKPAGDSEHNVGDSAHKPADSEHLAGTPHTTPPRDMPKVVVILQPAYLQLGSQILRTAQAGEKLPYLGEQDGWLKVRDNGAEVYVYPQFARVENDQ